MEPTMLWKFLSAFRDQVASKDVAAVQGAVAVIAALPLFATSM